MLGVTSKQEVLLPLQRDKMVSVRGYLSAKEKKKGKTLTWQLHRLPNRCCSISVQAISMKESHM